MKTTTYEEMTRTIEDIMQATTLDRLLDLLLSVKKDSLRNLDVSKLPTFGGPAITNPDGVWSWDAERLLVEGDSDEPFAIVPREAPRTHDCGREYVPKSATSCWYCHS